MDLSLLVQFDPVTRFGVLSTTMVAVNVHQAFPDGV